MSEESESRYLGFSRESIDQIERWRSGGRDVFLSHEIVQNAALYRLEPLAEAAGKLPTVFRNRHPETPWWSIADFRNRVSHGYPELDLDLVWRVIKDRRSLSEALLTVRIKPSTHSERAMQRCREQRHS